VGCVLGLQSDSANHIYHGREMVTRPRRLLHNVLLSNTWRSPPGLLSPPELSGRNGRDFLDVPTVGRQEVVPNAPKNPCRHGS